MNPSAAPLTSNYARDTINKNEICGFTATSNNADPETQLHPRSTPTKNSVIPKSTSTDD